MSKQAHNIGRSSLSIILSRFPDIRICAAMSSEYATLQLSQRNGESLVLPFISERLPQRTAPLQNTQALTFNLLLQTQTAMQKNGFRAWFRFFLSSLGQNEGSVSLFKPLTCRKHTAPFSTTHLISRNQHLIWGLRAPWVSGFTQSCISSAVTARGSESLLIQPRPRTQRGPGTLRSSHGQEMS